MAEPNLTLGLVGLGAFGEAIGRRLVRAGFPLMVFDIASGPLRYFVMKNEGEVALSPLVMAEMCNVVITVLPSVDAARATVFGPDGLAGGLRPGSILIEMGHSAAPAAKEQMAELVARGVTVLEAPARGTPVDAKKGKLVIPVAGDTAAVERVMPVLTALGEKITATGPAGSAETMAVLAGAVQAAAVLAAAEILQIAERRGIAPATFLEFCAGQGALGAAVVEALRPRETPRSLAASHSIGAVLNDVEATLAIAGAEGLALRQAELCRELWGALSRDRGPDDDHAAIVRWLATRSKPEAPDAAGGT
ncbi:MAG TPA: NAD(P)-dependent oxidoreductase [Alphaproteobacteria bacterium]|nr:NAD(P)-dependent oxidoreductase [Alphaproteobacteria bacterium]